MAEFIGTDWLLCSHLPNAVTGTHSTDANFSSAFVRDSETLSKAWVLAMTWMCSSVEEFNRIFSVS